MTRHNRTVVSLVLFLGGVCCWNPASAVETVPDPEPAVAAGRGDVVVRLRHGPVGHVLLLILVCARVLRLRRRGTEHARDAALGRLVPR